MSSDESREHPLEIDAGTSRRIFFLMLALLAGGVLAFYTLKPRPGPPPAEVAGDPMLVEGRELYLARCMSCHGSSGRGDGPIAKAQPGPPPGDLTDQTWKHGDQPDQVLGVVSKGVRDTAMPGWAGTFNPREIRAVSAYVYYLAHRHVPAELRAN